MNRFDGRNDRRNRFRAISKKGEDIGRGCPRPRGRRQTTAPTLSEILASSRISPRLLDSIRPCDDDVSPIECWTGGEKTEGFVQIWG